LSAIRGPPLQRPLTIGAIAYGFEVLAFFGQGVVLIDQGAVLVVVLFAGEVNDPTAH